MLGRERVNVRAPAHNIIQLIYGNKIILMWMWRVLWPVSQPRPNLTSLSRKKMPIQFVECASHAYRRCRRRFGGFWIRLFGFFYSNHKRIWMGCIHSINDNVVAIAECVLLVVRCAAIGWEIRPYTHNNHYNQTRQRYIYLVASSRW